MEFKDKFIAFIDILGFKAMIESAEGGAGRTLPEIHELLAELGREKDKDFYRVYGPKVCPNSSCNQKNLDFQITQVSDCAIVSSEISPAGAINIVNHCWGAAIMLLAQGVMIRGYITRGRIYHDGTSFMGTGYHEAYQRESNVSAFKQEANEKGTPFIEVDPSVCSYIHHQTDECAREMFSRYTKTDGDLTALFPFKRLSHSFMIAGPSSPPFDALKEKKSNDAMRQNLQDMKDRVLQYVNPSNARAVVQANHYIAALDTQIAICDKTDKMIDQLGSPILRRY